MKKEHMLLAGAGGIALMYMLSKGDGAAPMGFGGGGAPGLDTITTETITMPAGGDGLGAILLPPPDPGRFFQAPAWIKPDRGAAPAPTAAPTKKERFFIEQPTPYIGRADVEIEYVPYTGPVGKLMPRKESAKIQAGWAAAIESRKKARISKKEVSYFEQIPGSGFVVGAKRLKAFLGDTFF